MAGNIKLTPEELLAQSTEMASIQSEFESLFSQVTSSLNNLNGSWSEALAGNFSGKISAAQKSFSAVAEMMANGATAARVSANTFSEPGAVLSALSADMGSVSEINSSSTADSPAGADISLFGSVWKHTMHAQEDKNLRAKADSAEGKAYDAFSKGNVVEGIKQTGIAYINECGIGLKKMADIIPKVVTDLYQKETKDNYDPFGAYGATTNVEMSGVSTTSDAIANVANKYSSLR